jgi:hypothetical protein
LRGTNVGTSSRQRTRAAKRKPSMSTAGNLCLSHYPCQEKKSPTTRQQHPPPRTPILSTRTTHLQQTLFTRYSSHLFAMLAHH